MFPVTLQHILVPLDFSGPSDHALDVAVALARPSGARLTLLHAVVPPVTWDGGFGVVDVVGAMAGDAQAKLSERVVRTGLSCEALVRVGAPVDAILACIEQVAPDLVVMSTHGRTGLTHAMLGSVAERVLQRARCPVLVLPRHLS